MPVALNALREFPITPGEVTLVGCLGNVKFRVTDLVNGAVYALCIHQQAYNGLDELEAGNRWTQALGSAGIMVPRIVSARDGRTHVEVLISADGERRHSSMTHWQPGKSLSTILQTNADPATLGAHSFRFGSLLARMHHQASGWRLPPMFKRRCLDFDALIGDVAHWGRFEAHPALTADERRKLLDTRDRIEEALGAQPPTPSTFGLIHSNIHLRNVVIDDERLCLLNFDDSAFGWRLYDVGVALFHLQSRQNSSLTERALISGYRSVRGLNEREAATLPFFRLTRGLVIMGWFAQRPELSGTGAFRSLKNRILAECAEITP